MSKTYTILKEYIRENVNKMKLMYPNVEEEKIKNFIKKEVAENLQNHDIVLDNNYRMVSANTTMLDILEYIHKTKPIIAGFGVLFKNQNEALNPSAIMLKKFYDNRKAIKKLLHVYDPRSYEYGEADRGQMNEKINMNSYYGSAGNETSVFYNLYCAAATTLCGQSIISTTETGIEGFLSNNVKFYSTDDCLLFISRVIKEDIDTSILPEISIDELRHKLISTFRNPDDANLKIIDNVISNLSSKEIKIVYYKNNIYKFIKVPKIYKLLSDIMNNTPSFMNPNDVPKELLPKLEKLWEYLKIYVVYDYPIYNRINRLKYESRRTVLTIDTDSVMPTISKWISMMLEDFFKDNSKCTDYMQRKFICVNTMAFILTNLINKVLLSKYSKIANIPDDYASLLNFKNEMYYPRFVLTSTKKRYIGLLRLREGSEVYPEKIDTKGLDYKKATAPTVTKKFFEGLVRDYIMFQPVINVGYVIKQLDLFKDQIVASLNDGKLNFISPVSVKEIGAYKSPYEEQAVLATLAWNNLYEDAEISLPDKVYLLKLKLDKIKELDILQQRYPEIYQKVNEKILNSSNDTIRRRRLGVIAIPQSSDEIPEWMRDFIDINTIVNDNISKFYPVIESLGINLLQTKAETNYYSNLIVF